MAMFGAKCSHTREDGLPYISYEGVCEECGARVRQERAERLRAVYDAKKAQAIAAPRPGGVCGCPPLRIKLGGTRVAVRVPKQSPLHQLGCPDWYNIRSMADTSLSADDVEAMDA